MRFGQALGRILFVAFLIVRGVQHIHKPDDWSSQFVTKYSSYFDITSKLPQVVQNVPAKWLNLLHPQHISTYVTQYGSYIGYTELALAACIVLEIPLLPLIVGAFLFLESIIFFNPFNPKLGAEIYYLIVNLALVGIVYMMAFAPPLFKIPLPGKASEEKRQSGGAAGPKTTPGQTPGRGNSAGRKSGSKRD